MISPATLKHDGRTARWNISHGYSMDKPIGRQCWLRPPEIGIGLQNPNYTAFPQRMPRKGGCPAAASNASEIAPRTGSGSWTGGDGDVTVAIYGEETFNPADYADYFDQIRLSGVSPAGDSGSCVPGAPKSADIVSLTPGSAHPDDPIKPVDDLIPDLVLHFKESALCVSEGNTQAQLTWPLPGMSVFGYDEVTTR